jgi:phosphoadenosine phosphosulfate reductase
MKEKIDLDAVNPALEEATPLEIIQWAYEAFGSGLAMLSSMQETASSLTHMLYKLSLCDVEILFIDTEYHFKETLDLRDRMIKEYGVNIKTYYPEKSPEAQFREYGRELYLKDPDYKLCCKLRKEQPFLKAVQPFQCVLSGLMRSEGGSRKNIPIVVEDPRTGGYKVHPLANWTRHDVDAYNEDNHVLVHPLHAQGYPSIGCRTCTTPIQIGEDERAGRWRHIREQNPDVGTKLYCGINFSDVKK